MLTRILLSFDGGGTGVSGPTPVPGLELGDRVLVLCNSNGSPFTEAYGLVCVSAGELFLTNTDAATFFVLVERFTSDGPKTVILSGTVS